MIAPLQPRPATTSERCPGCGAKVFGSCLVCRPAFTAKGRFSPATLAVMRRHVKVSTLPGGEVRAVFQTEQSWREYVRELESQGIKGEE